MGDVIESLKINVNQDLQKVSTTSVNGKNDEPSETTISPIKANKEKT